MGNIELGIAISCYDLFNKHIFKITAKRTFGDATTTATTAHGKKIANKVSGTLFKKYTDSYFQHRISFKSEWKGSHPVKAIKNNMLHCLPQGKNLFCYHQGKNGVPEHQSQLLLLRWEGIFLSMDVYRCSASITLRYKILKIPKSP